ncbi:outer-membrane receptor for ferric coprogen and ferric-rhodotorulic acid [Paracoccus chinensis]|uniref:Outer-membrane receptor for ferric coprogen and ferric-rhodotorulic acid n=2 Tax=Paracoccus chinensis TaxID=525640 RepID=A0A1G9HSL2_9RHOB|nr:outer-membrane receptor for ferric coprogen and ferric-rhodotorulic acid [Paracoccus chinensis]
MFLTKYLGINKPANGRRDMTRLRLILLATVAIPLSAVPLAAQEAAETITLDTVTLRSTYDTEGTGSYTTDFISVGDKDTRSFREIPQSTTVVTRERLEDGGYTSLDTALRETPGVYVLSNDDGRSSLYSRGFEFDSLYLNGLPTPLSSIYGTQPDMAAVDHIEILRGPSGLFGGPGEPAGAINMRLKQPQDVFGTTLSASVGTWNNRRVEADVTGPLNDSGSVRGRIVGARGKRDSWIDNVENEVGVFYAALAIDVTPDTTASFALNYRGRDIAPFNGLPTDAEGNLLDLDRSTFTGADWNRFENDVTDYIAEVEHRLQDGGHLKFSALYSKANVGFLYANAAGPAAEDNTVSALSWLRRSYDQEAVSLDAHLSKPITLAGRETNLIVGMDWRRYDTELDEARGRIAGSFDLDDWDADVALPDTGFTSSTEGETEQYGLYAQWRVKPTDRFTVIAGGRLSWYDATATTTVLATGAQTVSEAEEKGEVTPYLGLIYDLGDTSSVYASYTEIFQPQTTTDVSGNLLDPRTGQQIELGYKAELRPGLNATAALFHLRDENRAVADPSNPGFALAQGEATVQGVELEATGNLAPNWELSAGYTYSDTDFDNTETAAGSEFYTPQHMLQVWTKYSFDQPGWDKLSLGGGIRAFSGFQNIARTATGGATTIEAPGYAVVDLMASYDLTERVTATLNVNNVLDRTYYERVGGTSVFNFYGEPRSVNFRIGAKF